MDYTHLGRTGIKVSRIALGTMEFGWQIDEADSVKIVDEALDGGINLFDTADVRTAALNCPKWRRATAQPEEVIGRRIARVSLAIVAAGFLPGTGDRDLNPGSSGPVRSPGHGSITHPRAVRPPAATLVAMLAKAHGDGLLDKQLTQLSRPKLLIIDELGYLPFEANAAHLFFQLVSRRYERGSILITSNRSVGEWGGVFGDPVIATAILDRLLHHSTVITIRGDSYRLRVKCRSGLLQKGRIGAGGDRNQRIMTPGSVLQFAEGGLNPSVRLTALAWLLHNPVVTAVITGPRTVVQLREKGRQGTLAAALE